MGRRKPASRPDLYPVARTVDPWEMEAPGMPSEAYGFLCDDDSAIADALSALGRAVEYLTPIVDKSEDDDCGDGHCGLDNIRDTIAALKNFGAAANELQTWCDNIRAHAERVQEASQALAERVQEADEIRDAIERYPGTAPHAWTDALQVVRTGGDLRDMWCAGKGRV